MVTRKEVSRDNINQEVKSKLSPQRQVGLNFAGEEKWDGALQCFTNRGSFGWTMV